MAVLIGNLLAAALPVASGCAGLRAPVPGPIVTSFAPVGRFAGHWGVDFAADPGTVVGAASAGVVTFAGSVAGRLSVTLSHGGGLRTSYSYLSSISVGVGDRVAERSAVGLSGPAHGTAVTHFSVRLGDQYQDPASWLECLRSPAAGLRLAPVFGWPVYPHASATRHTRRYIRSPSYGPSGCRRGGVPGARS